jgi:hypothetical protein
MKSAFVTDRLLRVSIFRRFGLALQRDKLDCR